MKEQPKVNACPHPVYVITNGVAFCNECKKSWRKENEY